mmetsp:Transcript_18086/g.27361  ORF Transcript_18086/g.27361 Transcript_18086/m.27361 type:complete len:276 (-) Transcript_18086:103-930(-)
MPQTTVNRQTVQLTHTMPSEWPWNLPEQKGSGYRKKLEGIKSSSELQQITRDAVAISPLKNANKKGFYSMPSEEAMDVIREFDTSQKDSDVVPIKVVRALASVLEDLTSLNAAISKSDLVYSTPPPASNRDSLEDQKWRKRMERLRLKSEETRYSNLTNNLPHVKEDDVTVRSMTYAASVGLNMIVAPISFGVFMYFFSGQIFSWVSNYEETDRSPNKTDIRRVITGVVSGVVMLFIEMILFVIRTHAIEKSVREKAKRKKVSPFGYTKPAASSN